MFKPAFVELIVLLACCAGTMPPRSDGCIPGDPGGSVTCQAKAYSLAP